MTTSLLRANLLNEIRYAERLCQRTARLYRRLQTFTTFITVVGGSAAISTALSSSAPDWLPLVGAGLLAVFGGLNIAIRPADKAAQNEMDAKRYAALRSKASAMDDALLQTALNEAHASDVPEVEPLRDVAYNDVVREIGQGSYVVSLKLHQRLIAAIA